MQVEGRRWKRARRHWVVRYWLEPLAWATGIATFAGGFFFLTELTGFRSRSDHTVAPAWLDVAVFAGTLFVIALVVHVMYARFADGDD